jgi:hypothetical protein
MTLLQMTISALAFAAVYATLFTMIGNRLPELLAALRGQPAPVQPAASRAFSRA